MAILPRDIMMDILSRLPVNSLLRFRHASMPFYSLIDTSEFIKLHLNCLTKTNSNPSFIFRGRNSTNTLSTSLDLLDNVLQLDKPFKSSNKMTQVVGSCKGLLLNRGMDL